MTDATGLVGVAAYVAAHFAVQLLHASPTGRLAVALNVIGPACILVSLVTYIAMGPLDAARRSA